MFPEVTCQTLANSCSMKRALWISVTNRNRIVRCVRITPSQPIAQKRFRKSFDFMENSLAMSSGNLMTNGTETADDTYHLLFGRYIYVVDEKVQEYWQVDLDSLDLDVYRILREIHSDNHQPLDVSGSGSLGYGN